MRFARTALGLLLTLAGLVVTVAGAVAAFWLVGPDNTDLHVSRELTSQGLAVITAPDLLDRHGPTLHVTATGDRAALRRRRAGPGRRELPGRVRRTPG